MTDINHRIFAAVDAGRDVIIATVLHTEGSVPRKSGAKLLIYHDGSSEGSIGGGAVEGDVLAIARELFRTKKSIIKKYSFNADEDINSLNLVCGGSMDILIEYADCGEENRAFYGSIGGCLARGEEVITVRKLAYEAHGLVIGNSIADKCRMDTNVKLFFDGDSIFERIKPQDSLYIIGAGHVGRETARFAKRVGFSVTVMDDRAEYADAEFFPDADRLVTVTDYKKLFIQENINGYSYIAIATRGHEHDMEALESALRTGAGYIGMMGSRKKKATIFARLSDIGFSDMDMSRISSPIGLEIGAETPEEIALSIVAEMVRHRARLR